MIFKKRKEEQETETAVYSVSAKEFAQMDADEREAWHPIDPKTERFPLFCKISPIVLVCSLILYGISCISKSFADLYNISLGASIRIILATVTNILPFSLAELIIILLPVIAFISIWYIIKYRCYSRKSTLVTIACMFSIVSIFFSTFILSFGISYKGSSLNEKLKFEESAVNKQDLYNTAEYLVNKINECEKKISFDENNFSIMPYSFNTMNQKLLSAYENFCNKYKITFTFPSKLKPVMMSEAMSYSHITGVYTFFTGEANINVNFPDYTIPYTAAHELAHQRGFAKEDEANMIAFLVCLESDDIYIQYSAYLNMFEYVGAALYKADKKMYSEIRDMLDKTILNEMRAYNVFFDKYSESVASQVSGTVNDVYLKTQGTEGQISYGMVVDLTVAYLKNNGLIGD